MTNETANTAAEVEVICERCAATTGLMQAALATQRRVFSIWGDVKRMHDVCKTCADEIDRYDR